jgi:cytochrome c553
MLLFRPLLGILFASACCIAGAFAGEERAPAAAARLTFEKDVRPIFKTYCFQCHGEEEKPKGKLDLRLARFIKRGGESGEAIVLGKHDESLLWERVDADEMPPGEKKLSEKDKRMIAAWIDGGAKTTRSEPESLPPGVEPTDEERAFWVFQPIRRPPLPTVRAAQAVRSPIDAFLLETLEANGLTFSPEADRRTLIRRASFDLTGLPPTPEEVDAFVADSSVNAYERLVDRLLESPHYGERWARHWLDVAGYADSDGYTPADPIRKYSFKYRDYLVRSLNADRRWDELIREQLAGDEMVSPPYANLSPEAIEKLVATGFLRMAADGTGDGEVDQSTARNDVIAGTIRIVSTSFLGLTVGCAQCHAHRYDPISHEDYYRLRALFEPAYDWKSWRLPDARLISLWTDGDRKRAADVDAEVKKLEDELTAAYNGLIKKVLERELAQVPEELRGKLREIHGLPAAKRTKEQAELIKAYPRIDVDRGNVYLYDLKAQREIEAAFSKKIDAAKARRPPDDYVHALSEVPGKIPTTYLFSRGDFQQPRQAVRPGELSVIAATAGAPQIADDDPNLPTTGRRLAYARHLTSGRHPLVARVLVNRVWLLHFGRGIVNSPGDFGHLGERPTHPALLDWLADEFMTQGWSLKQLHRTIMTSTAYRQSSKRTREIDAVDPENRWLARASVRRLEAEEVRDAILAVSGRLTARLYGPPVPVTPDEVGQIIVGADTRDSSNRPTGKTVDLGAEEFRRSLYILVRRSMPLSMLEAFDAPVMSPNCDRRASSTVAPQSLMMMNNEFVVRHSEVLADRVSALAGDDPAARVRLAWRLTFASEPTAEQVAAAVAYLGEQQKEFASSTAKDAPPPARRALATFCQALLNSNEFLYVD